MVSDATDGGVQRQLYLIIGSNLDIILGREAFVLQ